MTKIRELLASNIRKYRHARGWSQAKLAERVDTSVHYVGMLETKTKYPSPGSSASPPLSASILQTSFAEIDPGETVKSLKKAVWAEVGGVAAGPVGARIRELEGSEGEKAGKEN
ncbi:MAG: helix-turn-helix transcriptional regulator [Treponema sp.]|jgi:transcriptional regulator with XRE-family HTH domain|nr:helix-turn-helix transcriptional regulator [Treponema sp.]